MKDKRKFASELNRIIRMYYGRMQTQLAEVGLYRGQPPIMNLLHQNDGMSQKEMAHALNLSPATMTVTLKRMEKSGLIVRQMDDHDQRVLRVHLSEKGNRMWEQGEQQIRIVTQQLLEGFSEDEEEELLGYMHRIARNMEHVMEEERDPFDGIQG